MTKLATAQERFFAKMIDWGIMAIPPLIALYTINQWMLNEPQRIVVIYTIAGVTVGLFIILFVQWVLIAARGQTMGKFVMKIKMVDERKKKPGGFVQNLVVRTWLSGIMSGSLMYFLVDSLLVFRKDRRTIHDFIAKTIVIKVK